MIPGCKGKTFTVIKTFNEYQLSTVSTKSAVYLLVNQKNGNGKHLLNVHSKLLALKNIMLVINMCTGLFTELNCKWKSFKVDQAIYFRE